MAFRRIGYRKIPTKRVINGNYQEGMRYIGQAMKQLMQLENSMRFQKLKQLSSIFKDENVVIECWHGFGLSQVTITTRGGAKQEKKVTERCPCCVNCLLVGRITTVHEDLVYAVAHTPDYYYANSFLLDVEVCQTPHEEEGVFVELLNVPYADRHPDHEVGDLVAIMVNPFLRNTGAAAAVYINSEGAFSYNFTALEVNACLINDSYLRATEDPDILYDPTVTGIYATDDFITTKDTCTMTQYDQDYAADWVPYLALSFKCPYCFKVT